MKVKMGRDARCRRFSELVVNHDRLDEVRKAVHEALSPNSPIQTLAVFGPTGVGKSTLVEQVRRDLLRIHGVDPLLGPHERDTDPVVVVTCEDPSSYGGYDMKREHWSSILRESGDPFAEEHHDPHEAARRRRAGAKRIAAPRRSTGRDLKASVYSRLALRETRVLIFDEAQHMADTKSTDRLRQHLDAIKTFGLKSGIKQVLVGTEELLPLLRLNGQLARRMHEIPFDAYDYTFHEEIQSFFNAMMHLVRALPCANEAVFRRHVDDAFLRCAGCIGVYKEALGIALARSVERGKSAVTYGEVEKAMLSLERLEVVAESVFEFRRVMRRRGSEDWVRGKLGMPLKPKKRPKNEASDGDRASDEGNPGGAVFSTRPGERLPTRDEAYAGTGVPEFVDVEQEQCEEEQEQCEEEQEQCEEEEES